MAKTKKKTEQKLNPRQELFCLYFLKNFNATMAYQKVFKCSYDVALSNASRMMGNANIKKEIARLKAEKKKSIMINEDDILERYMKIAFADMTDYVEWGVIKVPVMDNFGNPVMLTNEYTGKKEMLMKNVNEIKFVDSKLVDGGLICQIKQGKDGASIKLEDRQKALDWLAGFFEMNPMDKHKKEFDNKKLEIELRKTGNEDDDIDTDDGFLDALNSEAGKVWEDEEI